MARIKLVIGERVSDNCDTYMYMYIPRGHAAILLMCVFVLLTTYPFSLGIQRLCMIMLFV